MKFWDSSAIVPLVVAEETSTVCTRLLDEAPLVWALTSVEIVSALERRARADGLDDETLATARGRLAALRDGWTEVWDLATVRDRAERLLAVHPLRAADSLQLAAALVACEERPRGMGFICLDRGLCAAATREGFEVMP